MLLDELLQAITAVADVSSSQHATSCQNPRGLPVLPLKFELVPRRILLGKRSWTQFWWTAWNLNLRKDIEAYGNGALNLVGRKETRT
jgi:hypothetical protein